MATTIKKQIFCAACQAKTEHDLALDKNSEIVATCANAGCGRTHKYPMTDSPQELDALIARHEAENAGQVTTEMADAEQEKHDARFRKLMGIA